MLHYLGCTCWKHALIKLQVEKNNNKNTQPSHGVQHPAQCPSTDTKARLQKHSLKEWEERMLHKMHFIPDGMELLSPTTLPCHHQRACPATAGHLHEQSPARPRDARAVFASWRGKVKPGARAPRWFSCEQMRGRKMAFICQKIIRNAFIWTSRFHSNGPFCSLNTPQ